MTVSVTSSVLRCKGQLKWAFTSFACVEMALRGLRVVEMAGLAPAPFAGMILSGEIARKKLFFHNNYNNFFITRQNALRIPTTFLLFRLDFGASVVRVDKTNQPSVVLDTLARWSVSRCAARPVTALYLLQKQALHCRGPEGRGRSGDSPGSVLRGRRPHRALPTWGDGEAGAGAAALPQAQPAAGLRKTDWVRPDGFPRSQGWPRHQLPRHLWRSLCESFPRFFHFLVAIQYS